MDKAEIDILGETSIVNGKMFLPWMDIDLKEPFKTSGLFEDPDGDLTLSQKQLKSFGGWKRISELANNPQMVELVSPLNIVQDVIADCSFVASLCITAAFQRKHKKRLITDCIYPRDAHEKPIYNPSGKYMVKLFYNGISRKVIVDDRLPCDKNGKLMCTYSKAAEFWPSIIEKAYMKLMGGYDFPGSNSSIDLQTLTGWIPEQIFLEDGKFDKNTTWMRMVGIGGSFNSSRERVDIHSFLCFFSFLF